jgi:hypothetical protein
MKRLLLLMLLTSFEMRADECCEPAPEEECCIHFRYPPVYENSRIIVPIEREPPVSHPSSHESSFFEQMTR